MAKISGKDRMIASVNSLTGRNDCVDAVLIQKRPKWALFAIIPVFLIVFIVTTAANLPAFLAGGLGGGLGALAFVMLTSYWVLGRAGSEVILAKSMKSSANAIEITEIYSTPAAISEVGGLMTTKVTLGGQMYYVSKAFMKRLREIVS